MEFKQFATIINSKFNSMTQNSLFKATIDRELLWSTYQDSFPEGENEIFRERRVHECNTCYAFIKKLGAIVTITPEGTLDSIWNVKGLSYPYDVVAEKMHSIVSSANIGSIFLSDESLVGKEYSFEETETTPIKWDHFYAVIPAKFISQSLATDRGEIETTVSVFNRALNEFTVESLETVIDLCDTIYRGTEFKPTVAKFLEAKLTYEQSNKALFIWQNYNKYPARIRNSAIGTLIININEGMDLESAVKAYESVVAPENYKRTTAVVTEGMKKQALQTINELGLEPSLARRHAHIDDISFNNVLFASKESAKLMKGSLSELLNSSSLAKVPTNANTISIDKFIDTVLPNSTKVEVLVENRHVSNFVSLVAPINPEAPNILKWNNNFSWSYNGEVTDSMKERVAAAGGKTNGYLRFSIQWNEDKMDQQNDLDAHCECPEGHIYFRNARGRLDVDITRPKGNIAVENITWPDLKSLRNGKYEFFVNDFSKNNKKGFRAQLEINGEIKEYEYPKAITKDVPVVTVIVLDGKLSVIEHIKSSTQQKVEWDVSTYQYKQVSTIMLSPNFWDEQAIGNKHYFFMLDGCKNPSDVRGFYNEFLSNELAPHRKTFEMLSSKMKCEPTEEQLSGLGFSSTQSNNLHVKVDGRPYNILFKD